MNNYYELLVHFAKLTPEKSALIIDDDLYSYQKLLELADNFAAKNNQYKKGTPYLIAADSFLEQLIYFLALQKLGALPILMHHDCTEKEQLAIKLYPPQKNDILGVLSSGSTGAPKVMYRTYNSWAGFFPAQNKIFMVASDTIIFLHGSLSFTGNLNSLLSVLFVGGTIVTSEKFSYHHWLDLIDRYKATCLYLVPTKLRLLTKDSKINKLLSVKSLFTGSQLLTPSVIRGLKQLLPNTKIILYYGASELNYITYAVVDRADRPRENLGLPFPETKISFKDGLIYVDTPYHVSGIDCPFSVKDTGYLNERGELIFTGRREAWLNKGGVKLNLDRLAAQIESIDGIESAVILPIADKIRGAVPIAFIVKAEYKNRTELRAAIRHQLKPTEIPQKIIFIPEIPLNDRGKIDRKVLERMIFMNKAKIAVVGVGGVGGYLGAKLIKNLDNVTLVARNARKTALEERSLILHSERDGEIAARPQNIVSSSELTAQDYIFICVKNYSLEKVCTEIAPAVTKDTVIIPVMNGVNPGDRIRKILPQATVIDALIYIVAFANPDFSITQQGDFAKIYIGKNDATAKEKTCIKNVADILERAEVDYGAASDITAAIWKKYILNCAFNVATAYYNLPIGDLRRDSKKAHEYEALINEAYSVAQAKNINISTAEIAKIIDRFYNEYADNATSSLMRDVAKKLPAEIETFSGYIVSEAKKYNLSVPVSTKMYHGLLAKYQN